MPADILNEIVTVKRARITAAEHSVPLEQLHDCARASRSHALTAALTNRNSLNVIAEFKRRSPSKGDIFLHADPRGIAADYEAGGARAISVLTEEDFFAGSIADLRAVRAATGLPILRKDFIISEYQIWESAAAGADALLLIVAALTDHELKTLRRLTEETLALDALVEVHNEKELQRALDAGATLIGVNNRDLRTFEVSLEVSERLAKQVPPATVLISESGLRSQSDLLRLKEIGYKGFLIGETLMKATNRRAALQSLLREENSRPKTGSSSLNHAG